MSRLCHATLPQFLGGLGVLGLSALVTWAVVPATLTFSRISFVAVIAVAAIFGAAVGWVLRPPRKSSESFSFAPEPLEQAVMSYLYDCKNEMADLKAMTRYLDRSTADILVACKILDRHRLVGLSSSSNPHARLLASGQQYVRNHDPTRRFKHVFRNKTSDKID